MAEAGTTDEKKITILLVEDNRDFAKLVQAYLNRFESNKFDIIWREHHAAAMAELESNNEIDIVLMDYFLPGKNGWQITKEMTEKKINVPVVFLTVNKDFDLALAVMKLGVEDYLVKEEVSSSILPRTILSVIERHRLKDRLVSLEVSKQRLRVIHETLASVVHQFEQPLAEMISIADELDKRMTADSQKSYVRMIIDNTKRIIEKLEKLKALKADKTVRYIKDIKMLDLSE
ncbi:MAG: response regulator [Ignavibacteriae bacterium]|nr:response regulator [Ignavibacteriota bacterium]